MAFLEIQEMFTHIYPEDMEVISRGDDAAMLSAIDAAVEELSGYLTKYDAQKILGAKGTERNPILLLFAKDIAAWHFCNLCNAGVDLDLREKRYDRAIEWLKNNQNKQNPNLPAARNTTSDCGCPKCRSAFDWGSNPKRDNHF